MKLNSLFISCFLIVLFACNTPMKKTEIRNESNDKNDEICYKILFLENCFQEKQKSLECLNKTNKYLSEVEKATNIESSAIKDIDGYHYSADSLFFKDLSKWREMLKCK